MLSVGGPARRHRRSAATRDRTTPPSRDRAPARRRTDVGSGPGPPPRPGMGQSLALGECRRTSIARRRHGDRQVHQLGGVLARALTPTEGALMARAGRPRRCAAPTAAIPTATRQPTMDSTAAEATLSTRSIGSSAYIVPISTGAARARWNQPRMAAPRASRVRASSGVMPDAGSCSVGGIARHTNA